MGQEPYANYHIYISTVVKKLNDYLCVDKINFFRKHNLSLRRRSSVDSIDESELYELIMDLELNIKDTFINKLLNAYDIAKKSDDLKYHLENIMKDVAIYEYDHSNNFIKDWQSYILRGL